MIYPIVIYGNPVLKKQATSITPDYPGLTTLIEDMFQTLDKADGVGLAAPQIGLGIRLFVVDLHLLVDEDPSYANYRKVFINAEITHYGQEEDSREEGCLSVPGLSEKVVRPVEITVRYFDEHWQEHTDTFSGFPARVIQHEYDHTLGHVFVDKISLIRRQLISTKLASMAKGKVKCRYKYKN